jgi:hypothetical protein
VIILQSPLFKGLVPKEVKMEKELFTEVTKALTDFISQGLNSLKWFNYPIRVTSKHPLGLKNETTLGINLYLYRISRNVSFRTPLGSSALQDIPIPMFNMHFLMNAYGKEDLLEQNRLIEASMRVLYSNPIFHLHDSQTLAQADLEYLTIEQITNLWMSLGCSHQLCVSYLVSIVDYGL